jgi:hypothetical protein
VPIDGRRQVERLGVDWRHGDGGKRVIGCQTVHAIPPCTGIGQDEPVENLNEARCPRRLANHERHTPNSSYAPRGARSTISQADARKVASGRVAKREWKMRPERGVRRGPADDEPRADPRF